MRETEERIAKINRIIEKEKSKPTNFFKELNLFEYKEGIEKIEKNTQEISEDNFSLECIKMLKDSTESKTFSSKNGLDFILYVNFFKNKKEGFYVEISENQYDFSDSYFLDTCLGWEGVCIVTDRDIFSKIRNTAKRTCIPINKCLSKAYKKEYVLHNSRGIFVECDTLEAILNKVNVSKIDYLAINSNEIDYISLKDFSFRKYLIDVISVNVDTPYVRMIEYILEDQGYYKALTHGNNFIYVMGKPLLHTNLSFENRLFIQSSSFLDCYLSTPIFILLLIILIAFLFCCGHCFKLMKYCFDEMDDD